MTPIKHVYWPPLKKGTNTQDLSSSPESVKKSISEACLIERSLQFK